MGQDSESFHVYAKPSNTWGSFSSDGRDEALGILGTLAPIDPPIHTAETLAMAEERALSILGVEQEECLYVTDSEKHVLRILINEKHHDAISRSQDRTAFVCGLLVICFSCLIAAVSMRLGAWPLLVFIAVGLVYYLGSRVKLFNEVEGIVVCEILLILTFVLIR